MTLQPGDCLLYAGKGLFDWVIAARTAHWTSHVEIAGLSPGMSWASRNGLGVNYYPTRFEGLSHVLRPTRRGGLCQIGDATTWAVSIVGTPYGWLELLNFVGLPIRNHGMFCSQFATEFYRHAGWQIFPDSDPSDVEPFRFLDLVNNGFQEIPL